MHFPSTTIMLHIQCPPTMQKFKHATSLLPFFHTYSSHNLIDDGIGYLWKRSDSSIAEQTQGKQALMKPSEVRGLCTSAGSGHQESHAAD